MLRPRGVWPHDALQGLGRAAAAALRPPIFLPMVTLATDEPALIEYLAIFATGKEEGAVSAIAHRAAH